MLEVLDENGEVFLSVLEGARLRLRPGSIIEVGPGRLVTMKGVEVLGDADQAS